MGIFLSLVLGFIICVGISISYGWKLSLVVLACIPVLMLCNHFVLKVSEGSSFEWNTINPSLFLWSGPN